MTAKYQEFKARFSRFLFTAFVTYRCTLCILTIYFEIILFSSVLYEDALNLYQSKRKAERADAEMHLQSILVHIKTNLTRLFDDTLNELRMAQDRNDSLASQISEDAKLKIRFSHM